MEVLPGGDGAHGASCSTRSTRRRVASSTSAGPARAPLREFDLLAGARRHGVLDDLHALQAWDFDAAPPLLACSFCRQRRSPAAAGATACAVLRRCSDPAVHDGPIEVFTGGRKSTDPGLRDLRSPSRASGGC